MKKILSYVVIVAMLVTLVTPSVSLAAGNNQTTNTKEVTDAGSMPVGDEVIVLTQGDKTIGSYKTFEEAFKNIADYDYKTNKTEYVITLQKDIQEDVVIPANKKIAIDLNGNKLTNVKSHTICNNSTNIRVIDKKGGGVVDNITHGKAAVYNNIKSNIKLEGGTFTRSKEASTGDSSSGNNSFYVVKNFGTMTIYDGVSVKFSDHNLGLFSSLIGNGWQDAAAAEAGKNGEPKPSAATRKAAVLDIKGGKFVGGQITIKNDDFGELTVSGGEIVQPSEERAAIANNHKATIKGGFIEAKGKNGQAIYSRYFNTGANKGELKIQGGFFKSTGTVIQAQKGSILDVSAGKFETSSKDSYIFDVWENVNSKIKNGQYIGVTVDKVANREDVFVEGYGPQTDANGNITVDVTEAATVATVTDKEGKVFRYTSLGSALSNALSGSTVKLHKNITLEKDVKTSEYGITFDLNGFSVNGENVESSDGVLYMRTTYGAKPVEGVDSTMRIINSKETGGEIKGTLPVKFNSGNSTFELPGEIGSGVKLVTLEQDADAIKLGTASYLVYSDTTKDYIKNGGFKVTNSNGKSYIYGSYSSATKKAADGVVTLLHNYTGTEKIYSGSKSAVLDLAGHTYKHTGKDNVVVDVNHPNVEITIKNGKIETTNENAVGVQLVGAPYVSNMNNRSVILDKVEITVPGEVYGIVTNGTETGNKVVLKSSILNVKEGYGIYFPSTGSVTIDNSVINAKYTGVQMCAGDLTVKGEKTEINVTGQPVPKENGDGVIADGAAISVIDRDGYKELGKVVIENGKFRAAEGVAAVKAYKFDGSNKEQEWKEAGEVVDVVKGTFSSEIPENLFADKSFAQMEKDENGNYVVVEDKEAPVITFADTGKVLTSGKVYDTKELRFKVSDEKLKVVEIDGKPAPMEKDAFVIRGYGEHTIKAIDDLDNITEIKVNLVVEKGIISKDTAKVELVGTLYATGYELTQGIKVVVGDAVLKEGVDYTVTGNKAVNPGQYEMTIKGIKGQYEGEMTVKYTVHEPMNPYLAKVTGIKTYVNGDKNTFTVKFNEVAGADNYTVAYKKNGAKSWTYVSTNGKRSYQMKLKAGDTIEARVCANRTIVGKNFRSGYSSSSYRMIGNRNVKSVLSYSKRNLKVSWAKSKNNYKGGKLYYNVAYRTNNGKFKVKSVSANKMNLKVVAGKYYQVKVRPVIKVGSKKFIGSYEGAYANRYAKYSYIKTLKAGKRQLKVTMGKASGTTGYQVVYATNKSFRGQKYYTNNGASKVKRNITKLKSGKRYYVKVRAYKQVKGVKYYGPYSKVRSLKAW